MTTSSPQDFDIQDTKLVKYNGKAAHVIVPAGVTVIDSYAFESKRSLRIVELPDTVTTIRNFAFVRCRALERVVIPQSVTDFGGGIIWECDQVLIYTPAGSAAAKYAADRNELFIPMDSNTSTPIFEDFIIQGTTLVKYYGDEAHVTVPAGVTAINGKAFYRRQKLKTVELPDTVTTIREYAFYDCRKLERIIIPQSVTELDSCMLKCDQVSIQAPAGSAAAKYTTRQRIPFIPMDSNTSTPDSADFIIQGTTLVKYYGNDAHVTVPAGVTVINHEAFYRRSRLKTVELPDTVTTIKRWAFRECRALERIVIPQSVTKLSSDLIEECDRVTIQAPAGSAAAICATEIPLRQRGPRPADWMPPQSHPLLCYRQGGNVHQLRGNILITVYLVTDKKTAWTAAAEADYRIAHNEAVREIEQEALRRKIPLRIHTVYKQIQVDYTCTVSESDRDWSDKMEAICLPDSAPGYDERPVILVVNKKLRSHAYPREKVNGILMSTAREYCVIGRNFRCFSGRTIRHELFHLFGAPDLYTPQSVKGPASRLLPGSIMNDGNITDALTAYCIGWTATLSPEALDFLWETREKPI
ncbi:MAG: leucine-rich repeat domain-containing protein [Oscillospiraceae bacterium]|nr:leucine-rich repeat domain-containing protein [Oscillospiraceae bacterium]